ncbi:MAG: hypothetical protein ACI9H8_001178 [Lysobacterales bacterium]|jgi:uncharacterized protein
MDLNLELPGDHYFIRSQDEQGIRIGDKFHTQSLIISAGHLITGWEPADLDELQDQHLLPIFELKPEILLLGTGDLQRFLPPKMQVSIYEKGIGVEVMTTKAACSTFNVLVSEGRIVVAALMQQHISP